MKKIALLSAATAAAFTLAPAAAFAADPVQKLEVKVSSTKSGTKKKPKSVGITFNTGTTTQTDDPKRKHTITSAKITLPKGIKINYKAFNSIACDLPAAEEKNGAWCADNAPKSALGTGNAEAEVVDIAFPPKGILTPYIGTDGRLLIRTQFDSPAVIDMPLIGKVGTSGGQYTFGFDVPTELQTPIENADQQINEFKLNFKAKTTKASKNKKVGIIETTSCPKTGWVFKGEFKFKNGETVNSETTVKCKQGK